MDWDPRGAGRGESKEKFKCHTMELGFSSYVSIINLCVQNIYWKSKSMKAADHAKQKLLKNVKEKELNAENWLCKWWKLDRGC